MCCGLHVHVCKYQCVHYYTSVHVSVDILDSASFLVSTDCLHIYVHAFLTLPCALHMYMVHYLSRIFGFLPKDRICTLYTHSFCHVCDDTLQSIDGQHSGILMFVEEKYSVQHVNKQTHTNMH